MKVKDKVIVVTGGANGVGREIVLQLLEKGAQVAAVDVDAISLSNLTKEVKQPIRLSIHQVDITDQGAINELVEEVIEHHGQIDGIINNAGIIQPFVSIHELEISRIEKVMDVNFYGTLHMIRAFIPHLKNCKVAHITNVSSMGGFFPVPGQGVYGASKAAVKLLTEALYAELHETNIGVSVVIPGGITTNIMKNSELASKETKVESSSTKILLSPKKAAQLVIKSMEKNRFRMIIGHDARFMYFLYQVRPKLAIRVMKKMLALG